MKTFTIAFLFSFFFIFSSYADSRPNFIIILTDDMGYADVSVNGCTDIQTPAIDSIANSGIRFQNGYVSAPQCAPSRTGIMTGMYQERIKCDNNALVNDFGVPVDIVMLPKRLKDLGYSTGAIGKWHLGTGEGQHPNDKGFDQFFGFLGGGNKYFPDTKKGSIGNFLRNKEKSDDAREYITFALAKEANKMIDGFVSEKKPFFLYLAFNAPHSPLKAPEDYIDKINKNLSKDRRTYLAMILAVDDAVKSVLDNLKKHNIEENTVIVFINDNGCPLDTVPCGSNAPFRGIKRDTLEGGIHIPFFVQWKAGIKNPSVDKTPVITLDLSATFLDLAGAQEIPSELDGKSLAPIFAGKQLEKRKLFWRFPFIVSTDTTYHVFAMRDGDMKIVSERIASKGHKYPVKFGDRETVFGMYDVSKDPSESDNLKEKQPDRFQEMIKAYEAWNKNLPSLGKNDGKEKKAKKRK